MIYFRTANLQRHREHIDPQIAWVCIRGGGGPFSPAERDHILDCERCLNLLTLCAKSETFTAALKQYGNLGHVA